MATFRVDGVGNIYGTASAGGLSSNCCGVVFELRRGADDRWAYHVLYQFEGGTDGANPQGNLTRDQDGNLYGTTFYGGEYGLGTVFESSHRVTLRKLSKRSRGYQRGHPRRWRRLPVVTERRPRPG
jgi:uncharacterized repeat protein (TIGR03803 family)